jgi:hypothetical protein
LEYLTAVRLIGGYLFQIVCFAETKVFDQVRPELTAAIESFELSSQATPAGQPTL